MPWGIRWTAAVEVRDAALDGGDDPEQGGAIEFVGRRSGGAHDEPEHMRSMQGWQEAETGRSAPEGPAPGPRSDMNHRLA